MGKLIFSALYYLLEFLKYAIIASAVISFLPVSRHNPFIRLLYQVTEPILAPIRRMLDRYSFGRNLMFDISPIIAIVLIEVIEQVAARILLSALGIY